MYIWEAIYEDGQSLKQFDETGEHLFKEIDQERLKVFIAKGDKHTAIVNLKDNTINIDGRTTEFEVFKDQKAELIYFKRNLLTVSQFGTRLESQTLGIGLRATINNKCVKRYFLVYDDKLKLCEK